MIYLQRQVRYTCAVRCDGTKLDSEWVADICVVIDGVVVAAAAIPELAAAQDGAVSEVKPQVVGEIALLTLPARRRDAACLKLKQLLCVPVNSKQWSAQQQLEKSRQTAAYSSITINI